jgi:hypothetical protein
MGKFYLIIGNNHDKIKQKQDITVLFSLI